MDGPKTTSRNDAAGMTLRDFSGSNRLPLIPIDKNGTRSVDGKAFYGLLCTIDLLKELELVCICPRQARPYLEDLRLK